MRRPADPVLRQKFLHAHSGLGIAELHLGQHDRRHLALALPHLQRAFYLAREDMRADPRNIRDKAAFIAHSSRLCSLLTTMRKFNTASALLEDAGKVARELTVLAPGGRRSWYLLGKIQLDLGWMYIKSGEPVKARKSFLASSEGFAHALTMDPTDTVILECRAGQFEGLARLAHATGNDLEARQWMRQCLDVIGGMMRRDPSVKSYIDDYDGKLQLARDVGVATTGL